MVVHCLVSTAMPYSRHWITRHPCARCASECETPEGVRFTSVELNAITPFNNARYLLLFTNDENKFPHTRARRDVPSTFAHNMCERPDRMTGCVRACLCVCVRASLCRFRRIFIVKILLTRVQCHLPIFTPEKGAHTKKKNEGKNVALAHTQHTLLSHKIFSLRSFSFKWINFPLQINHHRWKALVTSLTHRANCKVHNNDNKMNSKYSAGDVFTFAVWTMLLVLVGVRDAHAFIDGGSGSSSGSASGGTTFSTTSLSAPTVNGNLLTFCANIFAI